MTPNPFWMHIYIHFLAAHVWAGSLRAVFQGSSVLQTACKMVVELVSVSTCVDPFCLMYIAKSLKCGSGSSSADFCVVPRAVQAVCPAHPIVTYCSVAQLCLNLCDPKNYTQHTRFPCPSLSPGVCSDSCPLNH